MLVAQLGYQQASSAEHAHPVALGVVTLLDAVTFGVSEGHRDTDADREPSLMLTSGSPVWEEAYAGLQHLDHEVLAELGIRQPCHCRAWDSTEIAVWLATWARPSDLFPSSR